jgi:hypothetical protein
MTSIRKRRKTVIEEPRIEIITSLPPRPRSQHLTTISEEPATITQVDDHEEAIAIAIATAEGTKPETFIRLTLGKNRA